VFVRLFAAAAAAAATIKSRDELAGQLELVTEARKWVGAFMGGGLGGIVYKTMADEELPCLCSVYMVLWDLLESKKHQ